MYQLVPVMRAPPPGWALVAVEAARFLSGALSEAPALQACPRREAEFLPECPACECQCEAPSAEGDWTNFLGPAVGLANLVVGLINGCRAGRPRARAAPARRGRGMVEYPEAG